MSRKEVKLKKLLKELDREIKALKEANIKKTVMINELKKAMVTK